MNTQKLYALEVTSFIEDYSGLPIVRVAWIGWDCVHTPARADAYGNPTPRQLYQAATHMAGVLARITVEASGLGASGADGHGKRLPEEITAWELRRPWADDTPDLSVEFVVPLHDVDRFVKELQRIITDVTRVVPRNAKELYGDLDQPFGNNAPQLLRAVR